MGRRKKRGVGNRSTTQPSNQPNSLFTVKKRSADPSLSAPAQTPSGNMGAGLISNKRNVGGHPSSNKRTKPLGGFGGAATNLIGDSAPNVMGRDFGGGFRNKAFGMGRNLPGRMGERQNRAFGMGRDQRGMGMGRTNFLQGRGFGNTIKSENYTGGFGGKQNRMDEAGISRGDQMTGNYRPGPEKMAEIMAAQKARSVGMLSQGPQQIPGSGIAGPQQPMGGGFRGRRSQAFPNVKKGTTQAQVSNNAMKAAKSMLG